MALSKVNYQTRIDRVNNPPWGLNGGQAALGNQVGMKKKDGTLTTFSGGKVNMRLEPGESYVLHSGGGGGFGPTRKRARKSVLRDLRLGYISIDAAREQYSVALSSKELEELQHSFVQF